MRLHATELIVGPCLSKALCITHGSCCWSGPALPGRSLPVSCLRSPGPLQSQADGGITWEKHSAAVQCYSQSCHRAGKWLQCPCPLSLGKPRTEAVTGTSLHSEIGIPPAAVARLVLSKRLLPQGFSL